MALGLCQWLHFGAAMLAFGSQGFVLALVPADLARDLGPRLRQIAVSSAIVLVVTAAAWTLLQAADLSGVVLDPGVLFDVLTGTAFGQAWMVHLGLIAGLAAAIRLGAPAVVATLFSALALASLALVGHTNLHTGAPGVLHRACESLHLLSAGAWIGGLLPLLIVLHRPVSSERRQDIVTTLRRFSTWGHAVVATVVATGVGNLLLVLDARPLDGSPLYLAILSAKLAVVAVMIGLALFNRYGLVPRLGRRPGAQAWLARLTIGNLLCGTLALLLASVLGMTDPMAEP